MGGAAPPGAFGRGCGAKPPRAATSPRAAPAPTRGRPGGGWGAARPPEAARRAWPAGLRPGGRTRRAQSRAPAPGGSAEGAAAGSRRGAAARQDAGRHLVERGAGEWGCPAEPRNPPGASLCSRGGVWRRERSAGACGAGAGAVARRRRPENPSIPAAHCEAVALGCGVRAVALSLNHYGDAAAQLRRATPPRRGFPAPPG